MTLICIGLALVLFPLVVLAAWALVINRNTGLWGDSPGDEGLTPQQHRRDLE
jgi:hypothetical protein